MLWLHKRALPLGLGLGLGLTLAASTPALAFQVRQDKSRFDALVVADPSLTTAVATTPVESLSPGTPERIAWQNFKLARGAAWRVVLDRRSGAPLLVEGPGIRWGGRLEIDEIETSLRAFLAENRSILLANDAELTLDRAASGPEASDVRQVVFDRVVGGVPVAGDRYVFTFGHGNLIAFGASRWTPIDTDPAPAIDASEAFRRLAQYMRLEPDDTAKIVLPASLAFVPLPSRGDAGAAGPYAGEIGHGYASALVWRLAVAVFGEPGTWVALVDAHDGRIRGFWDDDRYAQVKGGAQPESVDGICPSGCEQPGFPMPYANLTIGASASTAGPMGLFTCAPGGSTATTTLAGPYARISDNCGAVSRSVTCDADLDLGLSAGSDCSVPAGASAGDTRSARTDFYHVNRLKEHARAWLPSNLWLTQQTTVNVNVNATCNASWGSGTLNMYKSGGGCNNTGEIPGVVQHEWGHGMDENDGGGFDNPSEAYADITELLTDHTSCIGRGFLQSGTCSGYGDTCLSCTGIRDMDWDQHANHQPATPSGFVSSACGSGSGPCGREVHCEGYVGGESLWDLAARDLPASGLDAATAWQVVDRLWYQSRTGSGGNAYTCALPSSDGCASTSWFSKLRAVDDDDGNLANGTPHAAAIFAAFNRHKIACGTAADASNQSTSACPALSAPSVTATAGTNSVALAWTAVPSAASYRVLRNDMGCGYSATVVAGVTAPTTTFTDTGLANGFGLYYRVQAVGANGSCDGTVSACRTATPQPFAGTVALDRAIYACLSTIGITVTDGNVGGPTASVTVRSTSEPGGEIVVLSQVSPGSASYSGTLAATAGTAAADGLLSVAHGDAITVDYIDADDGTGGTNVPRQATASADCVAPAISGVQARDVTGNSARITWSTDEPGSSLVHYGPSSPPASTASTAGLQAAHSVPLAGLAECTPYIFSVTSADAPGNSATDDASGAYYAFTTGKNSAASFSSGDTPIAIPDNNATGATSTIVVVDTKTVLDVNATVNITHTFDGDLTLTLIAPNGTQITLANTRGGSGDNFTATVFDDEAAAAIGSGAAPFTGSFRPETPLSAADGIPANGAWKLKAVDSANIDTGRIESWTLTLTFASQQCGPHASYESNAAVQDVCDTGGAGGDGTWDAGERVQFDVRVTNDGTQALTGVTATLTASTAGVTLLDASASYPDIPSGASSGSQAPFFTATLPPDLPCGSDVLFQLRIDAAQGSWTGSFTHKAGRILPGNQTPLNETFASGIPGTWAIVDGGSGGGNAATWTTSDPGSRAMTAPLASPVAIIDSDWANIGATQDEQLVTPVLDLQGAATATLQWDQYFRWYSAGQNEIGDVDVKSSKTGGAWVNVLRLQGASTADPDHRSVDVTAQAAGAADAQVRFHYYNASYEWWWQVDNVRVDTTAPAGCAMTVCGAAPPPAPKPVPDGSFGAPMTASRTDPSGSTIDVAWDVATCVSTDQDLLYGSLAGIASATIDGGVCSIGVGGHATWSNVPAGNLWFVIVGTDGAGTEGSWGTDGAGAPRGGSTPSGQCGNTARNNGGTCP